MSYIATERSDDLGAYLLVDKNIEWAFCVSGFDSRYLIVAGEQEISRLEKQVISISSNENVPLFKTLIEKSTALLLNKYPDYKSAYCGEFCPVVTRYELFEWPDKNQVLYDRQINASLKQEEACGDLIVNFERGRRNEIDESYQIIVSKERSYEELFKEFIFIIEKMLKAEVSLV